MLVIKIQGLDAEPLTKIVAKACYFSGFFVQSFCLPGRGYVKFDKKPLLSRQEEFSDFLLVLDSSQNLQEILKHAKERSVIILNAKEKPRSASMKKRKLKVYSLDATAIALQTIRKPDPSWVMLGALVKQCDKITSRAARLAVGDTKELQLAVDEGFRSVR